MPGAVTGVVGTTGIAAGAIGRAGTAPAGGIIPGGGIMPGIGASIGGMFGSCRSMLPMRTTARIVPLRLASSIGLAPGSSRVLTSSSAPATAAMSWNFSSGR